MEQDDLFNDLGEDFDGEEPRHSGKKKKSKASAGVLIAVIAAVVMLVAAVLLYFFVLKDMLSYNKAGELFQNGEYEAAKAAYTALGNYKDSSELVKRCDYRTACDLFVNGRLEEATALFEALGDYSDSRAWAENCHAAILTREYETAAALMEAGDLEGAKAAFLTLGDHADSADQVRECDYRLALSYMDSGDLYAARDLFEELGEYKDSTDMLTECMYRIALSLYEKGDYEGAAELFAGLIGYKDADSMLAATLAGMGMGAETDEEGPDGEEPEDGPEEARQNSEYDASGWRVGSYVTFGHYPQTQSGTDNTPIEWKVLEKRGNEFLLLSRYGLAGQQYYSKLRNTTWEASSMRTWLNDEFIYDAFTAAENGAIILSDIDNSRGQSLSNEPGGNDTRDKIFLLSSKEVMEYFPEKADRILTPTAYAKKTGAYAEPYSGLTWWWTRSPGNNQAVIASLNIDGGRTDYAVSQKSGAVRPAIWVDADLLP